MSDWIYGKDLIGHWDIEDFELFGFLKKGLQPYDEHGRKVIDLDSLEWDRERKLERCENLVRGREKAGIVMTNSGPIVSPRLTEQEIKQEGKELYESQTPKDSPYMSFNLPSNKKKATKAIASVKYFRFKKDKASEFAKEYGLPMFDQGSSNHTSAEERDKKESVETSPDDNYKTSQKVAHKYSKQANGIATPLTARDILTEGKKDVTARDILTEGKKDITARDILTENIDLTENIKRFEENPLDAKNNAEYLDKFIKKATLEFTEKRVNVFEEKPIETGKKAPPASKQMEGLSNADKDNHCKQVKEIPTNTSHSLHDVIEADKSESQELASLLSPQMQNIGERAFILKSDNWYVKYDGNDNTIKALPRIRYIVRLLEKPNNKIPHRELYSLIGNQCDDINEDYSKMSKEELNAEGLSENLTMIDRLDNEELEKLEEVIYEQHIKLNLNKPNSKEEWEKTKKSLLNEYGVKMFYTHSGPYFKTMSRLTEDFKKARSNVTNNILNAMKDIEKKMPALHAHLKQHIKTDGTCRYEIQEDELIPWDIRWE